MKKLTLTFLVYFKLGALQKFEIFKHFAKKIAIGLAENCVL